TVRRTFAMAGKMKAQFGADGDDDNARALRYIPTKPQQTVHCEPPEAPLRTTPDLLRVRRRSPCSNRARAFRR
ncbi:hypothetical protein, partial [Streptomyces tendae]